MDLEVVSVFLFISTIIVIGFAGAFFFDKTKIPDIVWLLLAGLLIGPVLGLVDVDIFLKITPLMAAIALAIILFDSGLNMELIQLLKQSPRATLLTLIVFILNIIAVALAMKYMLGWDYYRGAILGSIVGGTSSIIVISLVRQLNTREEVLMVLSIESIWTDVLCIVVTIAGTQILILKQSGSMSGAGHTLLSMFSIGAMIGIIAGIMWLFVLYKIRGRPFSYMLTLAMLFFIYAGVEFVNGSGAIGTLLFGLMLGNSHEISRMFQFKSSIKIDDMIKKFGAEVTFFIRAFFFVYLGIVVNISDLSFILYGALLAVLLALVRFAGVRLSMVKSIFNRKEMNLMSVMMPRGLAAAVLASMPAGMGYAEAASFPEIVFSVMIVSIVICTIGVYMIEGQRQAAQVHLDAAST